MKTKVNFCNLEKNIQPSALLQMFFNGLYGSGLELKCPFKKGLHSMLNYTLRIPAKVPLPKVKMYVQLKCFGRMGDAKKWNPVLTYNSFMQFTD